MPKNWVLSAWTAVLGQSSPPRYVHNPIECLYFYCHLNLACRQMNGPVYEAAPLPQELSASHQTPLEHPSLTHELPTSQALHLSATSGEVTLCACHLSTSLCSSTRACLGKQQEHKQCNKVVAFCPVISASHFWTQPAIWSLPLQCRPAAGSGRQRDVLGLGPLQLHGLGRWQPRRQLATGQPTCTAAGNQPHSTSWQRCGDVREACIMRRA
jgi:hypothetical protein